ncbi:MAG: right-handed parallel beta-helix repeat-containing protein [Armatimonadota bacterium]
MTKVMVTLLFICFAVVLVVSASAQVPYFANVQDYLSEDFAGDGSVDCTEGIQAALSENAAVYFPGGSSGEPVIYATRPDLTTQGGARVLFGPHTRLKRLPGEGAVLTLNRGTHLSGAVIDGNKYAHWPDHPDLGKRAYGVLMRGHCVVENCVVFNNPGIAFAAYSDENMVRGCRAENCGYIDVKFGADFYQGKWDKWSADGFYMRGSGNTVKDCVAYDCFRWDLCSSHSDARGNLYVDCRGGDVNFRTGRFVDIELAEPHNRLVRCRSTNSSIMVSTPHTEIIDCVADRICVYYDADYCTVRGCTLSGPLIVGSRNPEKRPEETGGASPIVRDNRIFLAPKWNDYGLRVSSTDGDGVVTGNFVYGWQKDEEESQGLKIEGIPDPSANVVQHGEWDFPAGMVQPRLEYGSVDWDHMTERKRAAFVTQFENYAAAADLPLEPDYMKVLIGPVDFAFDHEDTGFKRNWHTREGRPEDTETARLGWHWNARKGDVGGPAWYFVDFELPHKPGTEAMLFFGGVDSDAIVYVNGKQVGEHHDWETPFAVDITAAVNDSATNYLAVKVDSEGGLYGIYGPVAIVQY